MIVDDVLSFSVEYCNSRKERTIARKKKIRAAYKEVFGKEMRGSCPTCYIEAMLEIIRSFKKLNITKMAVNYELKRGVLLQEFGYPDKACTNDTLTDALAEWHLSRHPEKAVLFARLPSQIPPAASTVIEIIPPEQPVVIVPPKIKQEDLVKRKLLVDRVLELGFIVCPESPIELISSDELEIIIPNLEKAKADAEEIEKQRLENIRLKADAEERERLEAEIEVKKQANEKEQKAKAIAEKVDAEKVRKIEKPKKPKKLHKTKK